MSSRLPVTRLTWTSQVLTRAPHRGGGLPTSEPGLDADALDLAARLPGPSRRWGRPSHAADARMSAEGPQSARAGAPTMAADIVVRGR